MGLAGIVWLIDTQLYSQPDPWLSRHPFEGSYQDCWGGQSYF